MVTCLLVNDALAFDGVDFDEPMEVGLEEEKPAVTEAAEPESKVGAMAAVKVEPKAERPDPVLLYVAAFDVYFQGWDEIFRFLSFPERSD